jgi:hypothetical protein
MALFHLIKMIGEKEERKRETERKRQKGGVPGYVP